MFPRRPLHRLGTSWTISHCLSVFIRLSLFPHWRYVPVCLLTTQHNVTTLLQASGTADQDTPAQVCMYTSLFLSSLTLCCRIQTPEMIMMMIMVLMRPI